MSETMTATTAGSGTLYSTKTDWKSDAMRKRIKKRYAAETRFRFLGLAAIIISCAFLVFLLAVMIGNGAKGFERTEVALPVDLAAISGNAKPEDFTGEAGDAALASLELRQAVETAIIDEYGEKGRKIFGRSVWTEVRSAIMSNPDIINEKNTIWVSSSSPLDRLNKGDDVPELAEQYQILQSSDKIRSVFNIPFLTKSDGVDPALVGIWGALKGSLMTMLVTLMLAFPVGVLAAVYLEEYAPRNRWTDLIEVSINNLAAVPSIIFGLLGLVIFLNWMALPRSSALVGGLTLALMTMPVIVIAGRNAVKAVPPSIREAALGIGASKVQVIFHHVLPLAIPGIMTGTIIGMARALGETAPLLMIGMRAFTATPPGDLSDPSTVLPVQIFLWSDEINRGFVEKTSAAIIILLIFLLTMNALAIYLRNRFETRW